MPTTQSPPVLRHIRDLVAAENAGGLPDGDLLERFTRGRDEAAFEALVRRHGPLVFGVCRRVLGNAHDADDAFQATFLVLTRRAASIRQQDSLGSWLYRVAYHAALRAKAHAASRKAHEAQAVRERCGDPLAEVSGRELVAVLDEEIQRLADRHRAPLVLCYLEGRTRDEAAAQLGWSLGTLKRRLEQGRELLRSRLARRGLALPAALLVTSLAQGADVPVPAALAAATVKTVLPGAASAAAVALARATCGALFAPKLKTAAAILLLVGLLGFGVAVGASGVLAPQAAPVGEKKPAPLPQPAGEGDKEMVVQGRVEDAAGKAVTGAQVGVFVLPKELRQGQLVGEPRQRVADRVSTDARGGYRLRLPRPSGKEPLPPILAARAAGHGVALMAVRPDADGAETTLRLPAEQILKGRLIDLQGAPLKGLSMYVLVVYEKRGEETIGIVEPTKPSPLWFAPLQTDEQGRFQLRGVGRGQTVILELRDDRFNREPLNLWPTEDKRAVEVVHALAPGHTLRGRVIYADTGKPVAGAAVRVQGTRGKTDKDGRYHLNPTPEDLTAPGVFVVAPGGEPYLGVTKWLERPKMSAKLPPADFALPRGVLVRGKVTEAGSGKAIAGAVVYFIPCRANNPYYRDFLAVGSVFSVRSGREGQFQIAVLPGPGHLLARGPTAAYVPLEVSRMKLNEDRPGGVRQFVHALAPVNFKPGEAQGGVTLSLQRGATVRGKLLGPEGQAVNGATMLTRLSTSAPMAIEEVRGVPVPGGDFELDGCDPKKAYPVVFLDEKQQWGALVSISGKQAGKPLTVRLARCGTAKARFVDGEGNPLAGHWPVVEMLFAPGPHQYSQKATQGLLAADTVQLANVHRRAYQLDEHRTNTEGRITLPGLVPGVTYWIVSGGTVLREFTVRPGETLDLKDVRLGKGN